MKNTVSKLVKELEMSELLVIAEENGFSIRCSKEFSPDFKGTFIDLGELEGYENLKLIILNGNLEEKEKKEVLIHFLTK